MPDFDEISNYIMEGSSAALERYGQHIYMRMGQFGWKVEGRDFLGQLNAALAERGIRGTLGGPGIIFEKVGK